MGDTWSFYPDVSAYERELFSLTPEAADGRNRILGDIRQAERRTKFSAACWSKRHGKPSILTGCQWQGCEEW